MSRVDGVMGAAAALALCAALAGCGSGGSSSPIAPPAQFGPPVFTELGGTPQWLVFGDFDRDGKADAIAAVEGTKLVYLHGNGDGTFQATHTLLGPAVFYRAAAADLNRDGNLDLVTLACDSSPCGASGPVPYVFLGNGAGAFGLPAAYPAVTHGKSLAVGDFNGDSVPDLAVGRDYDAVVTVLLGTGDGALASPVSWPTLASFHLSPLHVIAADFNGDGKQDLAALAGGILAAASVLPGLGNGAFNPPVETGLGIFPSEVAVIDLNRDGKLDIVVNGSRNGTQPGYGYVTPLLGRGDGTFAVGSTAIDYPRPDLGVAFAAGDIDRDGIPDLVTLGSLGDLSLLYGRGDGTFLPHQEFPLPFAARFGSVELVDLNGDGRLDLVIHNGASLAALLNTR